MTWGEDVEGLLENLRVNALILSNYHKMTYFRVKKKLVYFRVPVIIISALASVFNVGLQPYIEQQIISGICCILSLIVGIIGSLEMYLQIQKKMENELIMSKDYYLIAIDIFKVLKLSPDNRNGEGIPYLEDKYTTYVKLFENSNLLEDDKINDQLAVLPYPPSSISGSGNSRTSNNSRHSFLTQIDNVIRRFTPPDTPTPMPTPPPPPPENFKIKPETKPEYEADDTFNGENPSLANKNVNVNVNDTITSDTIPNSNMLLTSKFNNIFSLKVPNQPNQNNMQNIYSSPPPPPTKKKLVPIITEAGSGGDDA